MLHWTLINIFKNNQQISGKLMVVHSEYALNQYLFFFKKFQKHAFLVTLDEIVEQSVYILFMVKSVKVSATVVNICVTSLSVAELTLKVKLW